MIHEAIFAALGPLVDGRCYPSTFIQPDGHLPAWPAIRYTVVGQSAEPSLCGTGDESGDDTRVQIDIVARQHAQMRALRTQVVAALAALVDPPCHRTGGLEEPDGETRTHRATLFYLFTPSVDD